MLLLAGSRLAGNASFSVASLAARKDARRQKRNRSRAERTAFPVPSRRSHYMSAWICVLAISLLVAIVQTHRTRPVTPAASAQLAPAVGVVHLVTYPGGASVIVDGKHYGFTPASLNLPAGQHLVVINMPGFSEYRQQLAVTTASEQTYSVVLSKPRR